MSTTWIPAATQDGSWTLVHAALQEGCHSSSGAWQQAVLRYARGCRLAERAGESGRCRLRLLDIGTGLGLNLAAALAELEGSACALEAVSLEESPEVIAAGCALYERVELRGRPWERAHATVRAALRAALAQPGARAPLGACGSLDLRVGDARAALPELPGGAFDAVFLDPFSPRRAPDLWADEFLAEVGRCMAPGSWLATYSASFRVRLGLARAGLHVGRGARVGAKGEGTLASPDQRPPALPPRLQRRLERRSQGQG